MNKILYFFLSFMPLFLQGQLVLKVETIPDLTPVADTIFVSGNFNDGENLDFFIPLEFDGSNWSVSLNVVPGTYNYSFSRGSSSSFEGSLFGAPIATRELVYLGDLQEVSHDVLGWLDFPSASTSTASVHVFNEAFYSAQLDRTRTIWVYLPEQYDQDNRNYPVLYLQDGQNLFDDFTSVQGEWGIDETMQAFADFEQAIIVAIESEQEFRNLEYAPPSISAASDAEGGQYIDFIVSELKPAIDQFYRTKPEAEFTGIGGSTLGATIALYGSILRPDIFSRVLLFSIDQSHKFEISQAIEEYGVASFSKVCLISGGEEGPETAENTLNLALELLDGGLLDMQLLNLVISDGEASEWFWKREFGNAYYWLFQQEENVTTGLSIHSEFEIELYPNPAIDQLHWQGSLEPNALITIFGNDGRFISSQLVTEAVTSINVAELESGYYFFQYFSPSNGQLKTLPFLKN